MKAAKCNRCGVLFEFKNGDLIITELSEKCKPPKSFEKDGDGQWESAIYNEDERYEMCTACSNDLREFLKPIKRKRHSQGVDS